MTIDLHQALHQRRIAVPESRELDVFANLLERRGATVLRCPLVSIRDAPDPQPVLDWLRDFIDGSCDDLILYTGEGLRRLLGALEHHQPSWHAAFVERLGTVRVLARGPKPVRVLRELGLKPSLVAEPATTAGIIETLQALDLQQRRVGVQLYGTEANQVLMDYLQAAGALALPVAPYVYADRSDDAAVLSLIAEMAAGKVDAIAFTSAQQVERLYRLAAEYQQTAQLQQALSTTLVAAVGPVVADWLQSHGIAAQVIPSDSYYLKPLTQALIDRLGSTGDGGPAGGDLARTQV